jgi:hypothetical protein
MIPVVNAWQFTLFLPQYETFKVLWRLSDQARSADGHPGKPVLDRRAVLAPCPLGTSLGLRGPLPTLVFDKEEVVVSVLNLIQRPETAAPGEADVPIFRIHNGRDCGAVQPICCQGLLPFGVLRSQWLLNCYYMVFCEGEKVSMIPRVWTSFVPVRKGTKALNSSSATWAMNLQYIEVS